MFIRYLFWLPVLLLITVKTVAQTEGRGQLLVLAAAGYERENFGWSIAGNSAGQSPNVYSELKWRGVGGLAMILGLQWENRRRWRISATGSRVFTRSGGMTDTDFGLDNRNDPIYHQEFNVVSGYSEAVSASVGYCVLNRGPFRLTPFAGYNIESQYFPITDPGGANSRLKSYYLAKWFGPFIKLEACWQLAKHWMVTADAAYHQVDYRAQADWNLIAAFAQPLSFRHRAEGYGVEAGTRLCYRVGSRIVLDIGGGYFNWQTGTGIDQLYLSAGGSDRTQLNGVTRDGWRGRAGLELRVGH